ncbi:MAG TPA: glycosyltransferase family A protein [Vicinamibacterales bacterium]|nr:glycosyltransferase family A protein [Vicinamibacterales bacterium]
MLATAGRHDRVLDLIGQVRATALGHDLEIVVALDGPEQEAQELRELGCVVDHQLERRGSAQAWNDALALSTGDPVVLAADDLEFRTGWLDAALETLAEFPDGWGLVGFNDGHWGEELSTHYLMSRRLITEVFGGVVSWGYEHSFTDREANERARRAGRYAWCKDAHVYHAHWLFGDRPQDATDTRLLDRHADAERRFSERQAAGFPNDFQAVIK